MIVFLSFNYLMILYYIKFILHKYNLQLNLILRK